MHVRLFSVFDDEWIYSGCTYTAVMIHPADDSDRDGIADIDEIELYGTDPHNNDTDRDGLSDGDELEYQSGNWNSDADGDGLNILCDPDSDNDGIGDGLEDGDGDGIGDFFAFKMGIAPGTQPVITKAYRYNAQSELVCSGPVLSAE